jgi:dienelactone hydrolase
MRVLESTLVLACAAFAACSLRFAGGSRATSIHWVHGTQLMLAAILVVQVLVEGWRWQMLPAYAATLVMAGMPSVPGLGAQTLVWSATASFVLLAAAVMSCLLLPFVPPQRPHGPFAVGVTTIAVNVTRARDTVADELQIAPLVRVWYPAKAPERSRLRTLLAARMSAGLQARPAIPAASDAPVADHTTRFPVVIYFDGWPEDRIQNINLIVELASRGIVVAAVQYPSRLDRPMLDYSSDAAFERSVQLDHARARSHAQDAIAVLEALSRLGAGTGSRFAQKLDTQRSGTLGFSYGGAIAAEASRLDPRIRAVVNMDGRHWGDALAHGVVRPYMFVCEELTMPTAAELASADPAIRYEARLDQVDYSQLAANLQALGGIRVTIAGAAHMNFTDFALRSPLRRWSGGGPIDARRAQEIIQTYVIEFFSRYLVSGRPPALDSPWPQLPGVRVQSWPAPKASL